MKGNDEVIDFLNKVLKMELTAINQYFLHAKMAGNWEYNDYASKSREESIDEMKHADELIERILFLEGLPNLQSLGKLRIGENVNEMLQCDLDLEIDAISDLQNAVAYADEIRDYVSRELFNSILASEEGHVDWLETQLTSIEKMGVENFIQHQS